MRRLFLTFVVIVMSLGSCCVLAKQSDEFCFVQLADTQLGFTNSNRDMDPEIRNFTKAVDYINRLKPAFVLISGDMVSTAHDTKQIRAFWRVAKGIRSDVPLYLVPGNHDLGPTKAEDIRSYCRLFGDDHYSFSYNGTEFIILNACLICDAGADSEMRTVQRKWFEERLSAARNNKAQHIFVCTHQSWFISSPDEADGYQNIPLAQRRDYLKLMDRFGVDFALAGHFHQNAVVHSGALEMITTAPLSLAFGNDSVGFRVFHVYKDHVKHDYYPIDQAPDVASVGSSCLAH